MCVRQSFLLLPNSVLPLTPEEQPKKGCSPKKVRTVCYFKDSGELPQGLLFHNLLSLMWATCPPLQRTHVLEHSRPEGDWAIFCQTTPHQMFAFAHKMCEKTQWGKCDLCWQRRAEASRDVALFRAQMPVDKTLLVHISRSLGVLTVCCQGFVSVPVAGLAHAT